MIGMLLDRFGDGAPFVRDANDQAAQSMMANLSSSGESKLPPALTIHDEGFWPSYGYFWNKIILLSEAFALRNAALL